MATMIVPMLTSMGASAATAATVGTIATYAGAAMTVIGGISQAQAQQDAAKYNAKSMQNAAQTNKNLADAKALQEEAVGQVAAKQKRQDLQLRLSRAYAVAASQGGGAPDESLISGLIDKGETAAQYDLYSSTERAKTLRFQGEQGLSTATAQGKNDIANAKAAGNATILGSVLKGASMIDFAPSDIPGSYQAIGAPVEDRSTLYQD